MQKHLCSFFSLCGDGYLEDFWQGIGMLQRKNKYHFSLFFGF